MKKFYFSAILCLVSIASFAARTTTLAGGGTPGGTVSCGATAKLIDSFTLAQSGTTATGTFNSVTITTAGTYVAGDLANMKLWYNTTNSLSGATAVVTSTTGLGAGSHTFTPTAITFNTGSTYYFWVTIATNTGAVGTHTISVNAMTSASYTMAAGTQNGSATATGVQTFLPKAITGGTAVCSGSTLSLSDSTSSGTWSVGGTTGSTISGVGVLTGGGTAGTATVSYSTGSCYSTNAVTVSAAPASITPAGSVTVCVGATTTLADATGTGTWSSSSPSKATVNTSGVVTGVAAGSDTIFYTTSGCTPVFKVITVSAAPTLVSASAAPNPICSGSTLSLTGVATGATTFSWSGPAAFSSTLQSPTTTASSSGVFTFTATNAGGCSTTANTASVTVNTPPGAISGATSVCAGSAISLSEGSTGGTWSVTAGTGTATINASGVLTGSTAGTVTVSYTTTGCTPATYGVTVNAQPAAITGSSTVCMPGSTTLADVTVGGTWTSGTTSVATVSGGVVSPVTVGSSIITYAIGTCRSTLTVNVVAVPSAITGGVSSLCATTLISQNFNSSLTGQVGGTWTVVNTGATGSGVYNWGIVTPTTYTDVSIGGDGSNYVGANADLSGSGVHVNSILYAPVVSTVGLTAASLAFNYYCESSSTFDVTADIEYSTDGSTWTQLYNYFNTTTGSTTWTVGTPTQSISLPSGALGQPTLYLRWNYNSTFGYYWVLDNVTLTGTIPNSSMILSESATSGTWNSTNTTVATVSAGTVTALAAGTDTVKYTNTCGVASWPFTVKAEPAAITGSNVVAVGNTATLSDAVSGGSWSSSNISVATIDATTGVVTGVAVGVDTISYSAGCGTVSYTINVTNPCTGTPTPGTVSSTSTYSCSTYSPTLSLTGSTIAAGITYQWKSSSDGVTFSSVGGATNSTYSPTVSDNTYYECVLTCSFSSSSATTTPLEELTPHITTFPDTENFDEISTTDMPCGWIAIDTNGDGNTWFTTTTGDGGGWSAATMATYQDNFDGDAADDWMITAPITVVPGDLYKLNFDYGGDGFDVESLEVKYGSSPTVAGMTSSAVFSNTNITSGSLSGSGDIFITPSTSKIYIGFHCNAAAFEGNLFLDDITIVHYPPCVAPSSIPTGLSCSTAEGTSTTISFTPASPVVDSYLVVASTSASLTSGPVNGTHYAIGASLGGGKVIALSAGGSVSSIVTSAIAGLSYSTAYHVFVYSFSGISCSGDPDYYSTAATTTFTTCVAPPAAPTTSGTVPGSTTVNWSTIAGATGFVVNAYSDSLATGSALATSGTLGSGTLSYTFTGLTNGLTYWFKVTAITSSCDAVSNSTKVGIPYGSPYYESFETSPTEGNIAPDNLRGNTAPYNSSSFVYGGEDDQYPIYNSSTFATIAAHTGGWDYLFQGKYNGSTYTDNWLVTPGIYLTSGTTYTVSFWYVTDYGDITTGTTYKWSSLKLQYSTNGTLPSNTATAMSGTPTTLSTTTNAAANAWTHITTTMTPASTGTYYFGILAASNTNSSYLAVDDIAICTAPTGLTASNSPTPVCQNGTLTLSASSTAPSSYTYTWSGATSAVGSTTTIASMPGTPTNPVYSVTVSSDAANSCSASTTTTATVTPVPTAITPTSSFVCPGSTVALAGGGATGAFWSSSASGQATVSTSGLVTAAAIPSPALSAGLNPVTITYNNGCGTPTTTTVNIGQTLSGTYNVGVGQTFPTLTSAIAAYNSLCGSLAGNVTFQLTDASYSTSETFPLTINSNSGSSHTLTIQPASGVSPVISGSSSTGVFVLNGSNNVIIDGSNSSTTNSICPSSTATQNMTITNTSATAGTGAVVWLTSGSTNNIIRNCIITGSGTANTLVGIGSGSSTVSLTSTGGGSNNNQFINNTISGVSAGIYSMGSSTTGNSGNTISQNTMTTSNGIGTNGILVGYEDNISITANTIKNMSTSSNVDIVGINAGFPNNGITSTATTGNTVTNATITNNVVGTISGVGTASAVGIACASFGSGTSVIANNEVFSILSRATIAADLTAGIYSGGNSGSGTLKVWYNSVYLSGASGGGTANTFGYAQSGSSANLLIESNIIDNVATGSSGTAYSVGLGFSSYSGFTSNNNDFVTTAAPLAGVGSLTSATNQTALTDWQTTTGQDAASFSLVPSFASATAPIDLHMVSGAGNNPTLNNNGATSGAPVSVDINCISRPTNPDMGINEFNGNPLPTVFISSLPPASSCPSANVNLTAMAITATGASSYALTTSGTYMPRVYFSRDGGVHWNSVQATGYTGPTAAGGDTSYWSFTIHPSDFTVGTTGVLTGGETISYYVVAQDQSTPASVASYPANVTATDVNTILAAPTTFNSYTYGYGTGTFSVGTGQTFTKLSTAISTIYTNTNTCLSGPITFQVTSNITETSAITIPTLTTSVPLTIQPASGVSPTISASLTTAVFILNGSSQVTIDGSYSGTTNSLCPLTAATRNMTIKNTNAGTSSAIIQLTTGASNNIIRNCILTGSGTSKTLFGIVSGGSTISTSTLGSGNNHNRFENNKVSACQYGIYSFGASASSKNVGNTINQNVMTTSSGLQYYGIWVGYEDSTNINGNSIGDFVNGSDYPTGICMGFGTSINSGTYTGSDVTNATVTLNKIDSIYNATTYDAYGIAYAGVTTGSSVTTIANNMISRTMSDGTASDFSAAIYLGGGGVSSSTSIVNVYYNAIYQAGSPGASDGSSPVCGIAVNSTSSAICPKVNIKNNVIVMTTTAGSGTKAPLLFESSSYTNIASASNDLYSSSGTVAAMDGTGSLVSATNTYSSIAAWHTASGQDAALGFPPVSLPISTPQGSISVSPTFTSTSSPIDLRLSTTGGNYLLNNTGTPVSTVTSDFNCATRDATYPDMGVNEITVNPTGCTSTTPGTISATVSAFCVTGSPTLSLVGASTGAGAYYQWQSSSTGSTWSSISGATNATYTPTVSATTYYRAQVACLNVSPVAQVQAALDTITIAPQPSVTSLAVSPALANICSGASISLTGTTTGGVGTPTYTWTGPGISSTTGSALTSPVLTPTVATTSSGAYSMTVSYSGSGCTTSAAFHTSSVYTVSPQPSITVLAVTPSALNICSGSTISLTATETGGSGSPVYTWTGPGISSTTGTSNLSPFLTPTASAATPGAYSVSVSYSGTGCNTATFSTSSIYTVSPMPAVYSVTGGNGCSVPGVVAGLSNSDTGYNYQLYNGASTVGLPISGTGSPLSFGTLTISGSYSVTATGALSGCQSSMIGSDTVQSSPSLTVGATPNVCVGATSALQAYSGVTGTPTTYSITYDGTAHTAGFGDVISASFPGGGVITEAVPSTAPAATYTGTLTVSNASCTSANYTVNVNVIAIPTASITSATPPCMGYTTSVVFSGTTGGVLDYVSEGDTLSATVSGGSYTVTTSALTSAKNYELIDIHDGTGTCYSIYDSIITINPVPMAWTGASDTNWSNAANWSCGFVPTVNDDVSIPSGTTYAPSLAASGSATTRNLSIASGVTLKLYSSSTLNVKGTLANNSTVSGAGTLSMSGSTAQHLQGMGYVSNLDINNTAGVNVDSGARPVITGALSLSGGMLSTGDSVVLNSDSTSGTARIAPITTGGAGISGKVQVRQYIDYGHRAYRFWSHPFSSSISLSQIEKFIDVTGDSGSIHGFTNTFTNAPSAFWYNPMHANSGMSYDPGWNPFHNALPTGNDTDMVHPYQGLRLFIRGSKGEGLAYPTSGPYTVDPATVGMSGPVNQGTQVVHLQKGTGANQDYNQIGNPYASPVDIGSIAHTAWANGQITGSAIFLWNPYIIPSGNWVSVNITTGTPYYMEAYTSFQVRAAANGDSLVFHETDKASGSSASLLRAAQGYLSLAVYDVNYQPWDMLRIQFNDQATDNEDNAWDAVRPSGPSGMNFYAWSADEKKMAIDGLPYADGKVIPLGLTSGYAQDFIMKVQGYDVPAGGQVYLHDKLLNQYTKLTDGMEYRFTITSDKATQGDNRFELRLGPVEAVKVNGLDVTMTPNPATDMVNIAFTSGKPGETKIRMTDVTGITVYNKSLGVQQNGSLNVSLSDLAAGIYMVELTNGDQKVVQRLVKE